MATTVNYGWTKPTVGGDADAWGGELNDDLDTIDATVFAVSGVANGASTVANAALPKAGGTLTGAVTGTSITLSGALLTTGTLGLGYATGAGNAVSQATSKSTSVTINSLTGRITMNNASLAAGGIVTFVVNCSSITGTCVVVVNHTSAGTIGGYTVTPNSPGTGVFSITVRNNTAGALAEGIVLRYAVIWAVDA